jgi:hypothetical protein
MWGINERYLYLRITTARLPWRDDSVWWQTCTMKHRTRK